MQANTKSEQGWRMLMKASKPFLFFVCLILEASTSSIRQEAHYRGKGLRAGFDEAEPAAKARVFGALAGLPMAFELNRGQTDASVRFLGRGRGYTMFLTSGEAVLSLAAAKPANHDARRVAARPDGREPERLSSFGALGGIIGQGKADSSGKGNREERVVRLRLIGVNPAPEVRGLEELPGKTNYFIGNDPSRWRTDIPTYAKVRYESVYPGIDLVYYGNQGQLEFDLTVAPGADPDRVQLGVDGCDRLEVDPEGNLLLGTGGGRIALRKPLAYQEAGRMRREVKVSYEVMNGSRVALRVAEYDGTRSLVIDPVLAYPTYLGGDGTDVGYGIAVDSAGNAYVTGYTQATNF